MLVADLPPAKKEPRTARAIPRPCGIVSYLRLPRMIKLYSRKPRKQWIFCAISCTLLCGNVTVPRGFPRVRVIAFGDVLHWLGYVWRKRRR